VNPYPSFTPSYDATTGQLRIAGGTYVAGAPKLQKVLFVLATPLGRYLPDPTIGLRYEVAKAPRAGLAAAWRAEVLRALEPLTKPREIVVARVPVELNFDPRRAGALLYGVVFYDPLDPDKTLHETPRLVV
jgi:hypothetical protein